MAISITFAEFKQITGQTNVIESTEFDIQKAWAVYILDKDTGTTWDSGDTDYELAQQAYAWLIAHMVKRGAYETMPDEASLDEITSPMRTGVRTDTFLEEYYRLINMINDTDRLSRNRDLPTFRLVESD